MDCASMELTFITIYRTTDDTKLALKDAASELTNDILQNIHDEEYKA